MGMNARKVVMFDIDGVLSNFLEGYRMVERRLGLEETHATHWDGYWNPAVWAEIEASRNFWLNLPSLVCRDTVRRIEDLTWSHDVYFVTNRKGADVLAQTKAWLHMRGLTSPNVVIARKSKRKAVAAEMLSADFAIDDKAGNAIAISWNEVHPTKSFLLDSIYNRGFNADTVGSKVVRVPSVDAFLDAIQEPAA
jgi:uncharacterized HAD superfamily protein